jgi:hypothetical protein
MAEKKFRMQEEICTAYPWDKKFSHMRTIWFIDADI